MDIVKINEQVLEIISKYGLTSVFHIMLTKSNASVLVSDYDELEKIGVPKVVDLNKDSDISYENNMEYSVVVGNVTFKNLKKGVIK